MRPAAAPGSWTLRSYPDARTFLGIEPTDDPSHWLLPLRKEIIAGKLSFEEQGSSTDGA